MVNNNNDDDDDDDDDDNNNNNRMIKAILKTNKLSYITNKFPLITRRMRKQRAYK